MKSSSVLLFSLAILSGAVLPSGAYAQASSDIVLQAGDVKVLPFTDLARVAVGDGKIVNAVTDGENELVLFAREAGQTVLNIWDKHNQSRQFHVQVRVAGEQKLQSQIRRMLNSIGRIRSTQVGDKIIVEGDDLSDADRERLRVLSRHFPQIVDMTSQIGWDQMVLLDVQILELPRNVLQDLGVKWGGSAGGLAMGAVWDTGSSRFAARPGDSVLAIPFKATAPAGYFGLNALLSASLQAMAREGQAVVLAQPQLMARSGATAEFLAGGEVPYVTTDRNGQNQTVFKPYGVSLHITPRIQKNGNVRSKIDVEVSSVDASMAVNGGPALKTRRTSTEFNVQSGQTLVLAGFISRDQFRNADKLPGVGDLPILGALFRSNRFQRNETELAIFVRPVVVSADHHDLQQRAARSRAIIDKTFGETPVLNTPVNAVTPTMSNAADGSPPQAYPIQVPPGQSWHFSREGRTDIHEQRNPHRAIVPIRARQSRWKPVLRLRLPDFDDIVRGSAK